MKKVFQTKINNVDGNCLQAAVASLFELALEDVPHFVATNGEWRDELKKFAHERGLQYLNVPLHSNTFEWFLRNNKHLKTECLVEVVSLHFPGTKHCVVGELTNGNLLILHDPNPNTDVESVECYEVLEVDLFFKS